jgi:predicted DCC family thiol-disulfide oxidoreductase YuxK
MSADLTVNAGVETRTASEAEAAAACLTVFHDGSCPLCRREIALVQKLTAGEAIAFVDVSGRDAGNVAPGLSADAAMARFHVRRADGQVISGAAAFLELWSQSPRLSWLSKFAARPLVVRGLDRIYSAVLVIRPAVARLVRRWEGRRRSR